MKQAQQTDRQRQAWIEHVFRAANRVMSGDQGAGKVDYVEAVKQQEPAGLPGKQQRTLQPKRDPNKDVAQIAEEKEILHSILSPIQRSPRDQPDRPDNLQPCG